MNISDDNVDRYVVRSSSFADAAEYALRQDWSMYEWTWLPAYTLKTNIQVFERKM